MDGDFTVCPACSGEDQMCVCDDDPDPRPVGVCGRHAVENYQRNARAMRGCGQCHDEGKPDPPRAQDRKAVADYWFERYTDARATGPPWCARCRCWYGFRRWPWHLHAVARFVYWWRGTSSRPS